MIDEQSLSHSSEGGVFLKTLKRVFVVLLVGVWLEQFQLYGEELSVSERLEYAEQLDLSTPEKFRQFRITVYEIAESGQNAAEILAMLTKIPDESKRRAVLVNVLEDIADNDPLPLMDWIEEDNLRVHRYFDDEVTASLASACPLRMLEMAKKVCPLFPKAEPQYSNATEEEWDRVWDSIRRRCWFEEEVVRNAFRALTERDRELALEKAKLFGSDSDNYAKAMKQIVSVWSGEDLASAKAFVQDTIAIKRPDLVNSLKGAIMERAGVNLYKNDEIDLNHFGIASTMINARFQTEEPDAVAEWIKSEIDDPEHRINLYEYLISLWVQTDAIAAMGWVGEFPEGIDRDSLIEEVLAGVRHGNPRGIPILVINKMLELVELLSDQHSDKAKIRAGVILLPRDYKVEDKDSDRQ